jgi:hypothetical protein
MRVLAAGVVAAFSLFTLPAQAACENPTMVAVPDGGNATMEELLAVQEQVKTYMGAMETYLACLNEELEAGGDDAPAEFKSLMVTRHNSAVTEMETIAAAFNQQVQAFKAANPGDQPAESE